MHTGVFIMSRNVLDIIHTFSIDPVSKPKILFSPKFKDGNYSEIVF